MGFEIIKFFVYSGLIAVISKYVLVVVLRKLAENLKLKAKSVGNISGAATSMPELLTITTSSIRGLSSTSIYNILSSNIINFSQYFVTIVLNKNVCKLSNKAIRIDIILVIMTIVLPVFLLIFDFEISISIVPIFLLLFLLFRYLNNNAHRLYLKKEDKEIEIEAQKKERFIRRDNKKLVKYIIVLTVTGVVLFVIGELLGNTLDNLCRRFNIPQVIIGILLGFITSIPELITFFESQRYHKKSKNEMLGVVEATNNLLTSNLINLFVIQTFAILLINVIAK